MPFSLEHSALKTEQFFINMYFTSRLSMYKHPFEMACRGLYPEMSRASETMLFCNWMLYIFVLHWAIVKYWHMMNRQSLMFTSSENGQPRFRGCRLAFKYLSTLTMRQSTIFHHEKWLKFLIYENILYNICQMSLVCYIIQVVVIHNNSWIAKQFVACRG